MGGSFYVLNMRLWRILDSGWRLSVSAFILDSDLTADTKKLHLRRSFFRGGRSPTQGEENTADGLGCRCLFVLQTQIQASNKQNILRDRAFLI